MDIRVFLIIFLLKNFEEILKKHQANGYKGFFDYFFVKEF